MTEFRGMLRKMYLYVAIWAVGYGLMVTTMNPGLFWGAQAVAITGMLGYVITPIIHGYKDPTFDL